MILKQIRLKADLPLKIVAIGGGTGLAAFLRSIKHEADRSYKPWQLTGIVTVSDDGGSSGRLRHELGGIPPGDLRNCLSALTKNESTLSKLLDYRFYSNGNLMGHSLGNLMLLAMADIAGDWVQAIRQLSNTLVTIGRLYPSTLESITLYAEDINGQIYRGETAIGSSLAKLSKFWIEPAYIEPLPEAILAILQADIIFLAPGSLYTSTIASLLISELSRTIVRTGLPVVYVANLMTQPGESGDMNLEDHIKAIQYFGKIQLRCIIANTTQLPKHLLERYNKDGSRPLVVNSSKICNIPVIARPLLDIKTDVARHDSILLNLAIKEVIESIQ